MHQHHHQDAVALAGRLLAAEGSDRKSLMRIVADVSGPCLMPKGISYYARPQAPEGQREVTVAPGKAHPLLIELDVRCRRCENCLRARATLWRLRAISETRRAQRTWFCTLTLSPEKQDEALYRARSRMSDQGIDYDALDYGDQFRIRVNMINPAITRFMKRLRKPLPVGALRYLWVAEAHKSGDPHFHALVHETIPCVALRKSVLEEQWQEGHGRFRLVRDIGQATYVCKYLSKSLAARVRASLGYGDPTSLDTVPVNDNRARENTTPTNNNSVSELSGPEL